MMVLVNVFVPLLYCCIFLVGDSSQAEVPDDATHLEVTNITAKSVLMNWTSGYDFGDKQMFYVMKEIPEIKSYTAYDVFNDTSIHPGSDNVSHVIDRLESDTEYTFAVLSKNAIGLSNLSESVTFRTLANKAPEDVTNVKVASITETSVLMTWTSGSGSGSKQRFYVMIEDPVLHIYIPFVEFNDTSEHPGIDNVSHVIGGLVSDTEYSFTVLASNLYGYSNLSAPVTFQTLSDNGILHGATIAGAVVGAVVFLVLIGGIVYLVWTWKANRGSYDMF